MLCILLGAATAGCAGAGHRISHTATDESMPHISWDLRSGREGEERPVCDSTQAAPTCVLQASTEQRRSTVTVHLHLHGASGAVNYVGVVRMPFLGAEGLSPEFSLTVPRGSQPVGRTTIGLVTPKPGKFAMEIGIDAFSEANRVPTAIRQRVPVIVQ